MITGHSSQAFVHPAVQRNFWSIGSFLVQLNLLKMQAGITTGLLASLLHPASFKAREISKQQMRHKGKPSNFNL